MIITEDMIETAARALASAQNIIREITREERLGTAEPNPFKIMRYAMGHEITEWHQRSQQKYYNPF